MILAATPPAATVPGHDVDYLGLAFDPRPLDAIVEALLQPVTTCVTVVTPNVDHLVRLHRAGRDMLLWPAYHDATLRLCDSRVVARLAQLQGIELPVVPGSDLTAKLFEQLEPGDKIALIGGDALTRGELAARRGDIAVVQHIPPMGMLRNPAAMAAAVEFIVAAQARFTFLAVGSPQQELLAMQVRAAPDARGVILCIGAGIEFLTGRLQRAPLWMQHGGVEWLHRLASNPRRLWRRYLIDGPQIFVLAWRHGRSKPPR